MDFFNVVGLWPEHGGAPGSTTVLVVGLFVFALAVTILMGSVLAILTTNVGFGRAMLLTAGTFFGYMVMHSITWVMSGNGPRLPPDSTGYDYLDNRLMGVGIGLLCLVAFILTMSLSHRNEREAQRVVED